MTSIGAINAAKIRAGHCYQCDTDLRLLPTLLERWQECAGCDRRWLVLSDRLIIERIRLGPEYQGVNTAGLLLSDDIWLIRWDGTAYEEPQISGEVWMEWPWPTPAEADP